MEPCMNLKWNDMDKTVNEAIRNCKALQGMTVEDVINSERYLNNLAAYIKAQRDDRKAIRASYDAMRKVCGASGYKLPAHPIDKTMDMSTAEFADEYKRIIAKTSALPAAQRAYIFQLGQQAYALTVAQIVSEEYPELRDKLIPKSKAN